MSRPLTSLMSKLVLDIPICLPAILVLRLQYRRLSKKLGVLNDDVIQNKGINIPANKRQNTPIRNTK
jgi:hypothetical protein